MNCIRDYRKKHNLTQQQLANEMGLDICVVNRLEHNIGQRTVRKVLLWCLRHNIDPIDVFPSQPAD